MEAKLRPDPEKNIIVVGYPRSGNTWLSRLLADALNCPVGGHRGANPLATEGLDRPGEYYVAQLHLTPRERGGDEAVPGAWDYIPTANRGEKIVHIVRDPRDVTVSAYHYWNMKNMDVAVRTVIEGANELGGIGTWGSFVRKWHDLKRGVNALVYYEGLHTNPVACIFRVLQLLGISPSNDLGDVIERQSIDAKRAQIRKDGDTRPYGRGAQLGHLRGGRVGDYRREMTDAQALSIANAFKYEMELYGYL